MDNITEHDGFGAFCYNTLNIGDEIQTLAAMNFLPSIDYFVLRDDMTKVYNANDLTLIPEEKLQKMKIPMIFNGWFMQTCNEVFNGKIYDPKNIIFPPPSYILPLCISMHMTPRLFKNDIFYEKFFPFLKSNEPIGCRDTYTYEQLKLRNVSAYVSGCLTLHFKNESTHKTNKKICATIEPIANMTHCNHIIEMRDFGINERFKIARNLLNEYMAADTVITDRLHCYLPCKSMGVDVTFVGNKNDVRMRGLIDGPHDIFRQISLNKINEWLKTLKKRETPL